LYSGKLAALFTKEIKMNLEYFKNQICEELHGAKDYIVNAIEIRAMDPTWSNTLVNMSAAELTHADNLYKMFEQYYATIAKPYGPGKVPDYMEDMKDEITQTYMEESAQIKYMHETYKK
jgi:hypothetical protein